MSEGAIISAPALTCESVCWIRISMVLSLISLFIFQFPIAYLLSKHTTLEAEGVYWAFPVTNIITTVITLVCYNRGTWKKKKVTEDRVVGKVIKETIIEEGIQ